MSRGCSGRSPDLVRRPAAKCQPVNAARARAVNAFPLTEHSEGESLFYIISPKDIVVAKERDQDDHIDWLLEKKKYEVGVVAPRSQKGSCLRSRRTELFCRRRRR